MSNVSKLVAAAAVAMSISASAQASGPVPIGSPYLHPSSGVIALLGGLSVSVLEPQFVWSCSSTPCVFAGDPRLSLVFTPTPGSNVGMAMGLVIVGAALDPVALVDPDGETVGYYRADFGKWRFDAVVNNGAAPAGSIFMTAYGHNEFHVNGLDVLALMSGGQTSTATVGPGSSGATSLVGESFMFQANVVTPYYAFPSKTDPRCASFSCLEFGAGELNSVSYVLSFDLVEVAAPVPEPGTLWTLLAGLGLSAACVSRRKAS